MAADTWSGRAGFVLAAIGSALRLGSIWKFPYEVGANGGAAFVLFYIAGLVVAVVPLMLAEAAIGRRGAGDAPASIERLAATVFSFNLWSHWTPTAYELVDHLTSNVMLPAGGLALFAGWGLPWQFLVEELGLTPRGGAALHWLLRWLTPALIAAVAFAPAFAA